MSFGHTMILGLIAGGTIVLGLPVGRLRGLRPSTRQFLSALAVGVLIFLVWDVLSHAWEPIDSALSAEGGAAWGTAIGYGAIFFTGLAIGLLTLAWYERRLHHVDLSPARLATLIAVGIGLHNFAEGLAIGQSAAVGDISLAVLLVIGFALHNATEGFGIVAPLSGQRPSWGFLAVMALIGGGPTLLGTMVGHSFTSEPVSVAFLTLAAGSILYVVIQLIGVAARQRRTDILATGIFFGMLAGFITDAIVTAGGA